MNRRFFFAVLAGLPIIGKHFAVASQQEAMPPVPRIPQRYITINHETDAARYIRGWVRKNEEHAIRQAEKATNMMDLGDRR